MVIRGMDSWFLRQVKPQTVPPTRSPARRLWGRLGSREDGMTEGRRPAGRERWGGCWVMIHGPCPLQGPPCPI